MTIRLRSKVLDAIREAEGGISRDELARRMKVASSTAYRVERGIGEPSARFIAALMCYTGKPFEELFELAEVAA